MTDCLFCKLIDRELPVTPVLETATMLAFPDIHPQAPHHYLVIPKQHIASLSEAEDQTLLLGDWLSTARQLTRQLSLADNYRVVINTGAEAGQSVFHMHLHLLAGRPLTWPPG